MKKVEFLPSCDGAEITEFIEKNSDMDWDDICNLEQMLEIYGDEGRSHGYVSYHNDMENFKPYFSVYRKKNATEEQQKFYQKMINRFFEENNLDKSKNLIILFND